MHEATATVHAQWMLILLQWNFGELYSSQEWRSYNLREGRCASVRDPCPYVVNFTSRDLPLKDDSTTVVHTKEVSSHCRVWPQKGIVQLAVYTAVSISGTQLWNKPQPSELACMVITFVFNRKNTKATSKCYHALHSYVGTVLDMISSLLHSIHPADMEINSLKIVCGCPCGSIIQKVKKQPHTHTHTHYSACAMHLSQYSCIYWVIPRAFSWGTQHPLSLSPPICAEIFTPTWKALPSLSPSLFPSFFLLLSQWEKKWGSASLLTDTRNWPVPPS